MSREYYTCFECKEKVHIDDMIEIEIKSKDKNDNEKITKKRYHKNCYDIHILKQKNQEDLNKLAIYISKEIMRYKVDDNGKARPLTKNMIQRLHSLRAGKIINRNVKVPYKMNEGNSYKLIYVAFKYNKSIIFKSTLKKNFKSEEQRFNYICAIVESKIPDVVIMLKKRKKEKENVNKLDAKDKFENVDKYKYESREEENTKKINDDKLKDKFKNMW